MQVVRHYPGRFHVYALAAHANIELLAQQIAEFQPRYVAVMQPEAAQRLRAQHPGTPVLEGVDGFCELAGHPVDVVLCAVVGAVGLRPLRAALQAGNTAAVANKEPVVMAGKLLMAEAKQHHTRILPVDSEHNAIFQCLLGHRTEDVQCIHLTASGGPFYRRDPKTLDAITPEEAASHPTWDMGRKISVDSATLMNKGLEMIEAMHLFEMPADKIQVVIHPQSIVHSLVEFRDGNILAHLGVTDMKFPILFALTWPERVETPMDRLDLTAMKELSFDTPDFSAFPCLAYARSAALTGGVAPAVLNAANEVAVAAFCRREIPFLAISEVVRKVLEGGPSHAADDYESVLAADETARAQAQQILSDFHPR